MSTAAACRECGRTLQPAARFCPGCGAAAAEPAEEPARTGSTWSRVADSPIRRLLVPGLVLVVVVAAVATYLLYPRPSDPGGTGTAPDPGPGVAQPADRSPYTGGAAPLTGGSAVPGTAPADADAALSATVDSDRATVERLVGLWLPQVSSKNGDPAAVLADHRTQAAAHPGTSFVLVRSSEFSSFRLGGYWVTLAAVPFRTPAEANAWCDANGYDDPNACFAKRLSQVEGPDGNTIHR